MNNPVISVIVPVYNVSKYLPKCIESILGQSFTEFELLLINDGSTDDSGKICDRYASKDSRIKVFHQENRKLSRTRNVGLDNARGRWLAFADSDDWMLEDYLKDLYAAVEKEETDILIVQGFAKYRNGEWIETAAFGKELIKEHEIMQVFKKYNLHCYGNVFSKLYNNSVIQNKRIRFEPQLSFGEDLKFLLDYLNCVSCVKFSSEVNYIYALHPGSLSNKYNDYNSEKFLCDRFRESIFILQQKTIMDAEISIGIKNYHASLLLRAISCMYRPNTFLKAKDRLENLSQLKEDELTNFYHFSKTFPSTLSYPLLLLSKQKLKLFDFWFLILFRIRYRFDMIWLLIRKYILK